MKKIISLILAAVMLATVFSAFAVSSNAENKYEVGQWVIMLSKIGSAPGNDLYYCIIGISNNKYCVATYAYDKARNEITKAETKTFFENRIGGTVYESKVPDVLKERAKQDLEKYNAGGFTLSGGNIWIIIIGAVVILGGIIAIIIFTKKVLIF